MSKLKPWLTALVLLVLLGGAAVFYGTYANREIEDTPTVGTTATVMPSTTESAVPKRVRMEDFMLEDANGKQVRLYDKLGSGMILNFWASWCGPCKTELPYFNELALESGVELMMINLASAERDPEDGRHYVAEQGYTFPMYYDLSGEAAGKAGITGIPVTIVLDKDGYILVRKVGLISRETLAEYMQLAKQG